MTNSNPYPTALFSQYRQFGFQQQQQVPTVSGGPMPGMSGFPQTGGAFPQTGAGFPQAGAGFPQTGFPQFPEAPTAPSVPGMLPIEQSYIENILRLNKGKIATVYATFENNSQWNAKIFKGAIEAAGRDHLILSDPETGMRFLIPMIYLDYVTFDEEIEYSYPFNGIQPSLSTFPPRR